MFSLRALISISAAAAISFAPLVARSASPASAPSKSSTSNIVVDDKTDEIIRGGLRYLASRQQPSGAWNASGSSYQTAFTAYALIAFMAAGQTPSEGEHGKTVQRGLQFLLDSVRPDGYVAAPVGENNMYCHGIATIALGEMYGMGRDAAIRPKLERAIKLIINCQNKEGGWRYQPRIADADISVSVLQVVALRVAKNSGIDVPQDTIDRAVAYVKHNQVPNSGGFGYSGPSGPGFARTAAAIYSLQVCGLYDDPMVARGSQYIFDSIGKDEKFWTYGCFYAGPAEYMIGGDSWERWYGQFSKRVLPVVKRQGDTCFWTPVDSQGVGEIYATSVYITLLSLPYGYMPIYQR